MSIVRSTLWFCGTALLIVVLSIVYGYHKNRFEIVKSPRGVYIFDRKTTVVNFCDESRCHLVSPEFVFPRQPLFPQQMMQQPQQMMQQPQQMMQSQRLLPAPTAPGVTQRPGTTSFSNAQTAYDRATVTARRPVAAVKKPAPAVVEAPEASDDDSSSSDDTEESGKEE